MRTPELFKIFNVGLLFFLIYPNDLPTSSDDSNPRTSTDTQNPVVTTPDGVERGGIFLTGGDHVKICAQWCIFDLMF